MLDLIVDPPVGYFSKPSEIRKWIWQLDQMEKKYAGKPASLEAVSDAQREAQEMLEFSEKIERR